MCEAPHPALYYAQGHVPSSFTGKTLSMFDMFVTLDRYCEVRFRQTQDVGKSERTEEIPLKHHQPLAKTWRDLTSSSMVK